MLTISFSIIPFALAKQRKTYLTDFLLSCEIKDEGFSNSPEEEDDVSFDANNQRYLGRSRKYCKHF